MSEIPRNTLEGEQSTPLGRVMIVPRGPYDPATPYKRLDLVRYEGSGFLALKDLTGVTPEEGENWMLVVSKGDAFEYSDFTPEQLEGLTGPQGKTGTTFTPAVSADGELSWTNDGEKPNPGNVNIRGPVGPDGKTGTTFTPAVSQDGELSWTNDGDKPNPEKVNIKGPIGPQGEPGKGMTILGYYDSLGALQAAVQEPTVGDNYGVGTEAPYKIYTYDGVSRTWKDNGTIQGPSGKDGEDGAPGKDGAPGDTWVPSVDPDTGDLTWEKNSDTPPSLVNIKGPQGEEGKQGKDGAEGPPGADGPAGPAGKDATINGKNVLTIQGGNNVKMNEAENTLTIGVAPAIKTVTLSSQKWVENSQTVEVEGVKSNELAQLIQPMPAIADQDAYIGAAIRCTGQGDGTLTFKAGAKNAPESDLTVYVAIWEVGA